MTFEILLHNRMVVVQICKFVMAILVENIRPIIYMQFDENIFEQHNHLHHHVGLEISAVKLGLGIWPGQGQFFWQSGWVL